MAFPSLLRSREIASRDSLGRASRTSGSRRRQIPLSLLLEHLEDRCLLSLQPAILEFPVPTPNSGLDFITAGSDGNLWFTEATTGNIGRITPAGVVTEFPVPDPFPIGQRLITITLGSDDNLWFSEPSREMIGVMTPAGVVTHEFSIPSPGAYAGLGTLGPDGNIWFPEIGVSRIGRITPAGQITEFLIPFPAGTVTTGPDGNLWFTSHYTNWIGRISTSGVVDVFSPSSDTRYGDITSGPDGNLWMTADLNHTILRVNTAGQLTGEFPTPMQNSDPLVITPGPDGNLWFTEAGANQLGRSR